MYKKKNLTSEQNLEEKVKQAEKALREAKEIARKNKIAYNFPVSFTEENYDPATDKQNEIEAKFKETIVEYNNKIKKELKIAEDALDKATSLSEESGIPFRFNPKFWDRRTDYKPYSFEDKWPTINLDDFYDQLNMYQIQSYQGWHSSESC